MTNKTCRAELYGHHDRMDELLELFSEKCHEELNKALTCRALNPSEFPPEESLLAKMVITLVGEAGHFRPLHPSHKHEMRNLAHFIG